MAKTNKVAPLTKYEIADKIARNVNFWVLTNGERKLALAAASFAGVRIKTRANLLAMGGFNIYFTKFPK